MLVSWTQRGAQALASRTGRRTLDFARDRTVLLFYEDFEKDRFVRYDRYLQRAARKLKHRFTRGQKTTGFYVWFQMLKSALEESGYRVEVNARLLARANPGYPVGMVGYPHILDHWKLPNPAVLGPGLFDHPTQAPNLFDDPRYRLYLSTCDWMQVLLERHYGPEHVRPWYGGIDVSTWRDTATMPKDIDVLVYDKIRWNRDHYEPALLQPVLDDLERRGKSVQLVRYGHYDHKEYLDLLARSRSMVFLCEHETQGMAYQEALACNVPLLAWDNGTWLDPRAHEFEKDPVPASSVPYFSDACGERFKDAAEFPAAADRFFASLPTYRPRQFVQQALSREGSARLYLRAYCEAGALPVPSDD